MIKLDTTSQVSQSWVWALRSRSGYRVNLTFFWSSKKKNPGHNDVNTIRSLAWPLQKHSRLVICPRRGYVSTHASFVEKIKHLAKEQPSFQPTRVGLLLASRAWLCSAAHAQHQNTSPPFAVARPSLHLYFLWAVCSRGDD